MTNDNPHEYFMTQIGLLYTIVSKAGLTLVY